MSDTSEPKSEAVDTPVVLAEPMMDAQAPPVVAKRRGGFGAFSGMVLGGLVAGGLGYVAGQVWPLVQAGSGDLAALQAEVTALKGAKAPADPRIDDLAARLDTLEAAPEIDPATADISGLEARLQGIEAALAAGPALSPNANADAAIKELQDEVARLKLAPAGSVDTSALKAEADAILAEAKAQAEAIAVATRAAAALDRLQAAMDSGAPFGASLADMTDPPDILVEWAALGVPSLTSLRETFPDTARGALEAAIQADMGDTWTDRALSFLQSSTGARSTVPREGSDPDAVLSRAEAAVAAGDLGAALSEIAALPAVAQEVMGPWMAEARTRLDATAAVADLTARIGG